MPLGHDAESQTDLRTVTSQYRLRTLLIAVTGFSVVAAINIRVALVIAAYVCPVAATLLFESLADSDEPAARFIGLFVYVGAMVIGVGLLILAVV